MGCLRSDSYDLILSDISRNGGNREGIAALPRLLRRQSRYGDCVLRGTRGSLAGSSSRWIWYHQHTGRIASSDHGRHGTTQALAGDSGKERPECCQGRHLEANKHEDHQRRTSGGRFLACGDCVPRRVKTLRVQMDKDAHGFVLYVMVVDQEVMKAGQTRNSAEEANVKHLQFSEEQDGGTSGPSTIMKRKRSSSTRKPRFALAKRSSCGRRTC